MKRMSFTNSRWSSLFGRSAFLVLFALCLAGLQNASAQVVMKYTKNDTTCTTFKLATCNGEPTSTSTRFTDDGTNDGNYADPTGHLRRDTTEFCPTDAWHRVKVVFTDFDLEGNDSLVAFQGKKSELRGPFTSTADSLTKRAALRPVAATGTGVSQAFGGWIDANCDPDSNKTGCLTFILYTDGTNSKGKGFDAWVDCENRNITLDAVNIVSRKLTCDSSAYGVITIPAPNVKICKTSVTNMVSDSVIVRISNQHGDVCIDTCLTNSGAISTVTDTFALGSYLVTYKLKSDTVKTRQATFSVQAPSLVCNDNINVPLGSACMIVLTPDDILEQPCDTMTDTMYYNITISFGSGKNAQTLTTKNVDNGGAVEYPIITKDALTKAGMSVCGATAKVKIERIYYGRTGTQSLATICNNGKVANSCETTIAFSDQSIPWITVSSTADTLVACDTTGLDKILSASAIDNCDDDIKVTYTVTMEEKDPCFAEKGKADTTTATVVFRAVDDCGNVGTKTETYTIIRPNENEHLAKVPNKKVDCSASSATTGVPGLKIGTYKNSTFTVHDTIDLSETDYICGYILKKRDVNIPATDCGRKIYRYWDIVDWCTPEVGPSAIDTTFIEFTDTKKPLFLDTLAKRISVANLPFQYKEIPAVDIDLGHFECTFDVNKLAKPKAVDNCDPNPAVRIDSIYRFEGGAKWPLSMSEWTKLNCDTFCVRWIADDVCHEQLVNDTVYQTVRVRDVTKPSAVCTDQLNISLPNEWGARVTVDDVDAGSFDACGIEKREIRIKGAGQPWAEFVNIGCQYVHPDLQLELRITDKKGNTNICWLDVVVEDKINPICTPLDPVTRKCTEFHNGELGASTDADGDRKFEDSEWTNLSAELQAIYDAQFGKFQCEDNLKTAECGKLETEEQYQLIEWPCGEIEIRRRHRSIDWSGNVSAYVTQEVKIEYHADWKFTLPDDWNGECEETEVAPDITIENGACDLLGFEVSEKRFDVPGDACFKIERTYHIINWCKYKAGDTPIVIARTEGEHGFATGKMITSVGNEDKGYFTYIQILKVHDDEGPVVTVVDPDECITGVEFDALPYGEEDQTPGAAPFECDELKTWTATATDCSAQSAITWRGELYRDLQGAGPNVLLATSDEPSLSYIVQPGDKLFAVFKAFDGCGNSGKGQSPVTTEFKDCKKPTPYLLNGIAVEIMETGMIQIWATDLNQGSFDNCTDQSKLDLRIWHAQLGEAPTTLQGVQALPKVLTLGCTELGTQNVHIYAIDEAGNYDFAQTYIIVQDNMGACTGQNEAGGMVAGRIVDGNGENVQSVAIAVNGADSKNMTTSADGYYQFELPMGGDYTVTPAKDINPLNGVSTFDLVLISKHILGISTFDTPYKYIAADVNKSGSITAFDMVQLRQLILNITSEFPNNTSWRFVEGGYEFTSANAAAESFNEFVSINNLDANLMNMDFTAVKIGDVNGSALANSLLGAESRTTNGTLNLNAADRFVEAGQTVTVEFTSADIATATGYQFTLNVAGAAEIVEGVAKAANFNVAAANRGLIATSWNGEATADDVLFAVTFTANTTGLLSELVSVSSDVTAAEAYNTDGELMNVAIDFNGAATAAGFELNQNTPNPFNATTVIGFNLPEAGAATLTVMDVQGKVLRAIQGEYAKGYNTVSLNANELGATGVLYYQLESANNVATKKMIIIE
ncbi:MAG: T9SS type A sorting domain-containing protein [Bacteroidota bacterium]